MTLIEALADAIGQIEHLSAAYHGEGFTGACAGEAEQCENCQGPIRPLRQALERARSNP